jgi:hypothetical protein
MAMLQVALGAYLHSVNFNASFGDTTNNNSQN